MNKCTPPSFQQIKQPAPRPKLRARARQLAASIIQFLPHILPPIGAVEISSVDFDELTPTSETLAPQADQVLHNVKLNTTSPLPKQLAQKTTDIIALIEKYCQSSSRSKRLKTAAINTTISSTIALLSAVPLLLGHLFSGALILCLHSIVYMVVANTRKSPLTRMARSARIELKELNGPGAPSRPEDMLIKKLASAHLKIANMINQEIKTAVPFLVLQNILLTILFNALVPHPSIIIFLSVCTVLSTALNALSGSVLISKPPWPGEAINLYADLLSPLDQQDLYDLMSEFSEKERAFALKLISRNDPQKAAVLAEKLRDVMIPNA